MASFGSFLVSISGPVAIRVMKSLGVGLVSYAGMQLVLDQIISHVSASYSGVGGAAGSLLGMIGFPEGMGIILGAMVARVTYTSLTRLSLLSS